MFEKLIVNTEDKDNYERNLFVKGEYLIKQIYDVLLDANNSEKVNWEEVLAVLKYDKSLRDEVYIFLASFEEYLKAELFRKYDVASKETIYRKNNLQKLCENIYKKQDDLNSNLYYCFELELGSIIELVKAKAIYEIGYIEKLDIVRQLRNHVMHHNILLLGKATNYSQAQKEMKELKKQLEALYDVLPNSGYKQAFQRALNEQIGRKYVDKLSLGEMKNGIYD